MLKHIVMWKLKEEARGVSKEDNAKQFKTLLEGCAGLVDGMHAFEVAIASECDAASFDVVLYSEFDSKEVLAAYQTHPTHAAIIPFVKEVSLERHVMDYHV